MYNVSVMSSKLYFVILACVTYPIIYNYRRSKANLRNNHSKRLTMKIHGNHLFVLALLLPHVLFQSRDVGEHLSTMKFSLTYSTIRLDYIHHTNIQTRGFHAGEYVASYVYVRTRARTTHDSWQKSMEAIPLGLCTKSMYYLLT